ncbi:hypothetical protein FJZ31_04175 [Candidatus Poribacteria bacterium]|nr:hypothetical protein [Candidatus Poribacteria bacterium]
MNFIFPNANEKICLVKADKENAKIRSGQRISNDNSLAQKIMDELNIPFHQSVIKLSQCSRNFVSNMDGPNILYLSQTEGGFPRRGLILKEGDSVIEYPNLNYVDLVIDEERLAKGFLQIYCHELGHVMMMNIWEHFLDRQSPKQHVSMGITDYPMAFFEGWGEHFQRLA